jgi:hypothetical protein
MQQPVIQYLVAPLVAAILTAVLSTYLTAHFSFRRFRREQWWQAKREAYESIIRKLAEIMFHASRELAKMESGPETSPPEAPERQKELSWSLQEIAASGAYIVSEKTVAEVGKFLKAVAATPVDDYSFSDIYGIIDREYGAAKEALGITRAEAHRELGVEGWSIRRWKRPPAKE